MYDFGLHDDSLECVEMFVTPPLPTKISSSHSQILTKFRNIFERVNLVRQDILV